MAQDDERFAILAQARRVWSVAAVHGDATKLMALHEQIVGRFRPGDRLVYLGNYVGVGGSVVETIDELLTFRREILCLPGIEPWDIVYLRGAQEEMWRKLLEIQFAPAPLEVYRWMIQQGLGETLRAYGRDPAQVEAVMRERAQAITRLTTSLRAAVRSHAGHDEFFAALRRAAYTAGNELLFVHAGVDPTRPLDAQRDTFWWGSSEFVDGPEPLLGFHRIVAGYDRQHRPAKVGHSIACIDAGAGFGGTLDAVCFDLSGQPVDWISV